MKRHSMILSFSSKSGLIHCRSTRLSLLQFMQTQSDLVYYTPPRFVQIKRFVLVADTLGRRRNGSQKHSRRTLPFLVLQIQQPQIVNKSYYLVTVRNVNNRSYLNYFTATNRQVHTCLFGVTRRDTKKPMF